MVRFRKQSAPETAGRLQGYIHTIWSGAAPFLRRYKAVKEGREAPDNGRQNDARAFQTVIDAFTELAR